MAAAARVRQPLAGRPAIPGERVVAENAGGKSDAIQIECEISTLDVEEDAHAIDTAHADSA